METKQKYYSLGKKDGSLYSYWSDGALANVPIVYEARPNKKAKQFDAKIIEVAPTHAIVDENDKPFIYFLFKEKYNETLPLLNLIDGHKGIKL